MPDYVFLLIVLVVFVVACLFGGDSDAKEEIPFE